MTSSRDTARRQLQDLARVGISWDEEPVFQSERFELYERAIDELALRGLTYECFCSRREVREAAEAPHTGSAPYPGTCRTLSVAVREERRRTRPPALRLLSRGQQIEFLDRGRGRVIGRADDIVLRRNDGIPSYNVAVVVDDALQGITEVVRGEDLLSVTPSQVALQGLLGYPTPEYHHVPLMMGPDGERLTKRHGAVTLADIAAEGRDIQEVVANLWDDLRAWWPYGKP